jgi:hypothetical protein
MGTETSKGIDELDELKDFKNSQNSSLYEIILFIEDVKIPIIKKVNSFV